MKILNNCKEWMARELDFNFEYDGGISAFADVKFGADWGLGFEISHKFFLFGYEYSDWLKRICMHIGPCAIWLDIPKHRKIK